MSLLDAALDYHRRGWSIIPIGRNKKPALVAWKPFQTRRPTEQELRDLFTSVPNIEGLAVVCGEVSGGLCIRDFDDAFSYEQWAAAHPELAAKLPTVRTSRGYHVYFTMHFGRIDKLGDGELRGKGYCLLPPSLHPNGTRYEWVVPLPVGELPTIDPFAVRLADSHPDRETDRPSVLSTLSALSVLSVSGQGDRLKTAIERAIASTLPNAVGERNDHVFELARALKGIPALADAPAQALREHVQEWHRRALPVIGTKSFDDTWSDFTWAWPRVKFPKGSNPLELAAQRAKTNPLPAVALRYDTSGVQLLVALCRELQVLAGDSAFFLACGDASTCTGLEYTTAWKRLGMLVRDGVLEVAKRGNQRWATRYRYRGGD